MASPAPFLDDDFLLKTETARRLYHDRARSLPIIDYHCHLPPADIAADRRFDNLTAIWLEGDHYKWRAMRAFGVEENRITGDASARDKFMAWSSVVPHTMRNPLYHWTHLELQRYFGVTELLNASSADRIYETCNGQLAQPAHSTRQLLTRMKVEVVCTTDDPVDTLEHHLSIRASGFAVKILPTFRPDAAYAIEDVQAWNRWREQLTACTGIDITSFDKLLQALAMRIGFFDEQGCRLSDHGLEFIPVPTRSTETPDQTIQGLLTGHTPNPEAAGNFRYRLLLELGRMYHRMGWTQQFHLGAIRNNNARALNTLGPNTGYDSIGDFPQARGMSKLFSDLDATDQLAQTILYNLNPADNEVFATMAGNFNGGGVRGKMQYGSAWWFLDQKDGMEKQLNTLSNMGMLSCFVGMLTDSRSFLSYPRHEYFRRTLCNLIGEDVRRGELPEDLPFLGSLVEDVCHRNAKSYFRF